MIKWPSVSGSEKLPLEASIAKTQCLFHINGIKKDHQNSQIKTISRLWQPRLGYAIDFLEIIRI